MPEKEYVVYMYEYMYEAGDVLLLIVMFFPVYTDVRFHTDNRGFARRTGLPRC